MIHYVWEFSELILSRRAQRPSPTAHSAARGRGQKRAPRALWRLSVLRKLRRRLQKVTRSL